MIANDFSGKYFYPLEEFVFSDHNSKIIQESFNHFYFFRADGFEGVFNKEVENTRKYGRYLCDLVKVEFNCMGFFTSDELPRYGINRVQKRKLFESIDKKEGQLIVFLVYDYQKATDIRKFVISALEKKDILAKYNIKINLEN